MLDRQAGDLLALDRLFALIQQAGGNVALLVIGSLSLGFALYNVIGGFLVTAVAGALMVSSFPYYSGKDLNLTGRVKFAYVLIIPLIFMIISLNPPVVLFGLFFAYAMSGPVLAMARRTRRQRRREQARAAEEE